MRYWDLADCCVFNANNRAKFFFVKLKDLNPFFTAAIGKMVG